MRLLLVSFFGAAAAALALAAGHGSESSRSAADLSVRSRVTVAGTTIVAGAVSAKPGWGVALVVPPRRLGRPPLLVTTDTPTGPLRVVRTGDRALLLRSAQGWLYDLELVGEDGDPVLYTYGPRLDPARLPALRGRGVAIPVPLGGRGRTAVLLVGFDRWLRPKLVGYLPGFALPKPTSPAQRLTRPLVGPGGGLYRLAPDGRRLVRIAPAATARAWRPDSEPPRRGCTSWPAADGASYRACPGGITRVARGGGSTVVRRERACRPSCLDRNWESVLPSPDGRTLLVQQGVYACGGQWTTYFLGATGGPLRRTVPQFDFSSSWSLGWIDADRALVVADAVGECVQPRSGIYGVDRRAPGVPPQPIALAPSHDATLWSAA